MNKVDVIYCMSIVKLCTINEIQTGVTAVSERISLTRLANDAINFASGHQFSTLQELQ